MFSSYDATDQCRNALKIASYSVITMKATLKQKYFSVITNCIVFEG